MKIRRSLLVSVFLPGALALAQWRVPAPAKAPGSDALLQSIRIAPDPSSSIEAYSRGLAAGRGETVSLQRAFVGRMVDLGAPELADAQAHDLIKRGAADALIAGIAAVLYVIFVEDLHLVRWEHEPSETAHDHQPAETPPMVAELVHA